MKLFIALWPDEPVRVALAAGLAALARAAGGRPTSPPNLHLTVAFIGPVDDRRFGDIAGLLAVTRPPPFALVLDRLDAFLSQRVLFRAPSRCPAELLDAQQELVSRIAVAGLPVDRRPFRPHVTLARRCDRAALAAVVGQPGRGQQPDGAGALPRVAAGPAPDFVPGPTTGLPSVVPPVTWHAPGWALVESRSARGGVVYHPHVVL